MTDKRALDLVYAASTPEELAHAYAAWAASYDRETAELGYCLPFLITSWVPRHVAKGDGPLLDAGCGTGLTGPYLKALGHEAIEGLDLSGDMLRIAESRGAYTALRQAELGKELPWPNGHFRAVFSTGVFTEGHAPATAVDEIARITKPGGHVILTVRDSILETGGFRRKFKELEASGSWRAVEESPPFRAFAIAEPEVLVKAFVFRVS